MADDSTKKVVLAIETSCDETAVAFLSYENNAYSSLGQRLYSQIDVHKEFGGVFPMMAKREHGKNLLKLLELLYLDTHAKSEHITISEHAKQNALATLVRESELHTFFETALTDSTSILYKKPNIDAIAVTVGPGLEPALWVGISFAKALALIWNIPIIPVNHMEGHIASVLTDIAHTENKTSLFPALALLISGGHTEVIQIKNWGQYQIIGGTKDDAVGEAYDKVARILGLPYPGGPEISKLAQQVRDTYSIHDAETICKKENIKLPRPMLHSQNIDFSFSGLKTAVLYLVRDLKKISNTETLTDTQISLICFEFEQAVIEVLCKKLTTALEQNQDTQTLIVGGGVIANTYIRKHIDTWCTENNIKFLKPETELSTDNAVMIGIAALVQMNHGYETRIEPTVSSLEKLVARGGWRIDELY